jgi:hypothetical protein
MSGDGLHQITPPSAVVLDERKYPVVIPEPTWSQICEQGVLGKSAEPLRRCLGCSNGGGAARSGRGAPAAASPPSRGP